MKIEILIKGDPDMKPFTKVFDYDRSIFMKSGLLIKKHLSNGRLLNIDDTLGLFMVYIIDSLDKTKRINEIQDNIPKLVSSDQVMIGVPEILRRLTIKIIDRAETKIIHVTEPIPINRYFFNEQTV